MNYNLNKIYDEAKEKKSTLAAVKSLLSHVVEDKRILAMAFTAMIVSAVLSLLSPYLIGYTVDHYIRTKMYHGVLLFGGLLLTMYIGSLITGYVQTKLMGTVGQNMLFTLRNMLFNNLQQLPLDFFNQNKAGDLISRINNDTDNINQFFSQSLMQFLRFILIMIGAAIFLLSINLPLGAAALAPGLLIWVFTRFISPWIKRKNTASMRSVGYLSSAVQESLNNFKVIVAFNRRDYFREKFNQSNQENYSNAVSAGLANNLLMPVYTFLSNTGQMIVLVFGIYLISVGDFSIGLLISFLAYVTSFYNPLRQLASLWANFQTALAAWDRISVILNMRSNLQVIPLLPESAIKAAAPLPAGDGKGEQDSESLVSFKNVSFAYPNGADVLHNVSFELKRGKTYALVGPTGGGKTTIASLIARLYDPVKGTVLLDGRDIRTWEPEDRTRRIGFILQEPFLFTGTVRENILYGNEKYRDYTNDQMAELIARAGLTGLLDRFEQGLDTRIYLSGGGMSLGQQQLIAFMRTILRRPQLLILDEATANIDTVTEQLLEDILEKLPETSTKVIIAHRLNTIENADEIYFVNSGEVIHAGSLADAVDMLMQGKRVS